VALDKKTSRAKAAMWVLGAAPLALVSACVGFPALILATGSALFDKIRGQTRSPFTKDLITISINATCGAMLVMENSILAVRRVFYSTPLGYQYRHEYPASKKRRDSFIKGVCQRFCEQQCKIFYNNTAFLKPKKVKALQIAVSFISLPLDVCLSLITVPAMIVTGGKVEILRKVAYLSLSAPYTTVRDDLRRFFAIIK